MTDFQSMGLPQPLLDALARMEFNTPTPIQEQSIPHALEGKDILGSAQTGTGKTGAFGIPLVAKLLSQSRGSALVLTPTRELAMQVITMLNQLIGRNSSIKSALLIGGDSMAKQLQALRVRPRLIVGTPGRINDHLQRGSLMLHDTNYLVLDETDRMLDMGFGIQLEKIFKYLPAVRQTLMFSATLPQEIVRLSGQYLNDPVRVSVGSTSAPAANIQQELLHTTEGDKYGHLLDELDKREGSVIVFVKTKYNAERMAKRLSDEGHEADAIHGDLRQNKRDRVISMFRSRRYRILVATDIAARGLDIPHIEHVINYDLPQCPEDYIHRIGRTARAGAEGAAINLLTAADGGKWRAIQRLINPTAKHERFPSPVKPQGRRPATPRPSHEAQEGAAAHHDGFEARKLRTERSSRGEFSEGRPARAPRGEFGGEARRERAPRGEFGGEARRERAPRGEFGGEGRRERAPRGEFGGEGRRERAPRGEFSGEGRRERAPRGEFGGEGRRERAPRGEFGGEGRRERAPRGEFGGEGRRERAPRGEFGGEGRRERAPRGEFGGEARRERPARAEQPRSEQRFDKPRSDKPRADKPRGDRSVAKIDSSKTFRAEGSGFGSKKPAAKKPAGKKKAFSEGRAGFGKGGKTARTGGRPTARRAS